MSGLALGVDAAAHSGALEGPAPPVAVLAGGSDRPYPASKRHLHAAVRAAGAVVSEMPPGFGIHRWAFVARNRLIAALARVVVVVEATERSGSLTTADFGAELGRTVAAVPGRVNCALADGMNGLIRDGAVLVRGVPDVLDALAELTGGQYEIAPRADPELEPGLRRLLEEIGAGHSTLPMLADRGIAARDVLAGLGRARGAAGSSRRGFGGRYERVLPNLIAVSERPVPAVLSIAGSDSGGGAGIQADLKAFARCGVHGMTAIAALTAQNTVAVTGVHPVPGEFIVAQVRAVAEDIGVDAVKIGMLGTADTVRAVREALDLLDPGTPDRARPRDGRRVRRGAARRAGARGDRRRAAAAGHRDHAERAGGARARRRPDGGDTAATTSRRSRGGCTRSARRRSS